MSKKVSIDTAGQKNFKINYRKSFDLSNRVAIVTGGLGLLGKHFCRGLAESGAAVAIFDRNKRETEIFARSLTELYGVQSRGYVCDVSDPNSTKKMVEKVVLDFGKINILHNNAACKSDDLSKFFAPFEDYSLDQWKKIMSVNIDGMFLMAQAVGKQMLRQKEGGTIIQTSSIYGVMAPDQRIYEGSFYLGREINTPAVYTTSKAAIIGLTKHLAAYWAKNGIRVNTLTPGGVESGQNEEFKNRYSDRVPIGRMANVTEMVGALLYLASDASSYVTGQNIVVDGGLNCV